MNRNLTGAGNGRTLIRFASVSAVGALEFEGIAATDALCDDGYALSIPGGDISRFSDGMGPLLLEHKPNQIIGTASAKNAACRHDARKIRLSWCVTDCR